MKSEALQQLRAVSRQGSVEQPTSCWSGRPVAPGVWDVSERAVGFGALFRTVAAQGSLDVGLPVGPNFFIFSVPHHSAIARAGAGFVSALCQQVQQTWCVAHPKRVYTALTERSVRASAALDETVRSYERMDTSECQCRHCSPSPSVQPTSIEVKQPMKTPRIALCGIALESNAFSPVATEDDFRELCYVDGNALLREGRADVSVICREMAGFVQAMDCTGPWTPVPLVFTASHPWGPVDHAFLSRVVDDIIARLTAAGGADAVYVANHGAMVSTESTDPDGYLYQRLRDVLGADAPIVGTLDLHANVSERMVDATDLLIGYQTNPHVDMLERGEEAAYAMRAILAGIATPKPVFIRMPIVAPSVTLLTREGPYADLIDYGQRRKREMAGRILNVTLLGGFAFSDTPENGLAIIVSGRHDEAPARELAVEIAKRAWADRERFRKTLTPVDEAIALARGNQGRPLIFSDAGDNPGGGGGGDTTELLRALVAVDARAVFFGAFFDAALAHDAHQAGVGSQITAVFNREQRTRFSERLEVTARVVALNTEPFVGRRGIYGGRQILAQPSAALEIGGPGGITVVVISHRYQCADPMFFEHLGLDIASARTVCVKSRGHFRAGFDLWLEPEQVIEVDTAGLTSPVLERLPWERLPRPVFPLDEEVTWSPPNW